jgi:hypothetical protein
MMAFYYWTLLIVRDVYLKAAGSKIRHVDAEGIVASPSHDMVSLPQGSGQVFGSKS